MENRESGLSSTTACASSSGRMQARAVLRAREGRDPTRTDERTRNISPLFWARRRHRRSQGLSLAHLVAFEHRTAYHVKSDDHFTYRQLISFLTFFVDERKVKTSDTHCRAGFLSEKQLGHEKLPARGPADEIFSDRNWI